MLDSKDVCRSQTSHYPKRRSEGSDLALGLHNQHIGHATGSLIHTSPPMTYTKSGVSTNGAHSFLNPCTKVTSKGACIDVRYQINKTSVPSSKLVLKWLNIL